MIREQIIILFQGSDRQAETNNSIVDSKNIDALEVFFNDRYVFPDENNVECSKPCSKEDADKGY